MHPGRLMAKMMMMMLIMIVMIMMMMMVVAYQPFCVFHVSQTFYWEVLNQNAAMATAYFISRLQETVLIIFEPDAYA